MRDGLMGAPMPLPRRCPGRASACGARPVRADGLGLMWMSSLAKRNMIVSAGFALPAVLFMGSFFLYPLFDVVSQSVTSSDGTFTVEGYRKLLESAVFPKVLWNTIETSFVATLLTLLVAYPIAYYLATKPPRRRALLMILLLLPFWTSILVKSFAFMLIFGREGIVNQGLRFLLGPSAGLPLLYNHTGVMLGLTHYFIPLMTFPILASLLLQDRNLEKAAQVMGAGSVRIFLRVTLPLSMPGIIAGCLLTYVLALGFFITPALLGGAKDMMVANLVDIYMRETLDWTRSSAISVVLLVLSVGVLVFLSVMPGARSVLERGYGR